MAQAESSSLRRETIQLNIISPSVQFQKITFPDISASCTIGELKQKICDTSPLRIAAARQRLIYRGHVLTEEQRTLRDVFGQDTIDDANEPLTLHLILPPPAPSTTPVAPVPPNGQRLPPSQPVNGNPGIGPYPPNSQQGGQVPHPGPRQALPQGPHLPAQHGQPAMPQGQIPPPFPQTFAQIHAMNQQMVTQLAAIRNNHANNPSLQSMQPNEFQGQPMQQPQAQHFQTSYVHPRLLQQLMAEQQHAMAVGQQLAMAAGQQPAMAVGQQLAMAAGQQPAMAAGQQPAMAVGQQPVMAVGQQPVMAVGQQPAMAVGQQPAMAVGQQPVMTAEQQHGMAEGQQGFPMDTQRPSSAPPPGNENTPLIFRHHFGPNGERWQTVQRGNVSMTRIGPTIPPVNNHPHLRSGTTISQAPQPTRTTSAIPMAADTPEQPQAPSHHHDHQPNTPLQFLAQNLSSMETAIAMGNAPPEIVVGQARNMLQTITGIPIDQESALLLRIDMIEFRANQIRMNQDSQLHHAAEQLAAQRSPQNAESSNVYVLSSPTGPQALLVSPSGYYTAPWQVPTMAPSMVPYTMIQHQPNAFAPHPAAQNQVLNAQHPQAEALQRLAQGQPEGHQQIDVANMAQVHQQQQQEVNQAGDLVRVILPLGGHLWLMIRLFGFVYFFTHGASWHRTILLGLVALVVFVAQTGVFRPLIQAVWDPIRRHVEGLLPLAGNERPREGNADARPDAAGTQAVRREPTPQQAAERLLQERERQDGNLLRQGLRRAERAVALFVASLVPGVGERHIAAREAAEATRQTEAREREERVRREEEEARQQPEGVDGAGIARSDVNAQATSEQGDTSTASQPEQAAQPPLIEV